MGIRVYFNLGAKNGALDFILNAPLEAFRTWYWKQWTGADEILTDEIEEPQLALLDRVINEGAAAFAVESAEQARLIDLLVSHFYYWCDWEKTGLLVEVAGTIKVYNYEDVKDDVRRLFGVEAARLWRYMLNGRSVGRRLYPYTPREEGYPDAYWTYEEVCFLHQCLIPDKCPAPAIKVAVTAIEAAFVQETGLIIEVA